MQEHNTKAERDFFEAICQGRVDDVRRLAAASPALLHAFDYGCFGATAITRACFQNDQSMVLALIELGADVDCRSDWDMGPWSPLHYAVFGRQTDLAELLLANGATLDVHGAAGLGLVDKVIQLLDQSPERIVEPGGDGCHPLHFADSIDVAQALLDRGADIEARCMDHFSTPVQYLADKRSAVARFLFSLGAQPDIFSAVLAGDQQVVERLLREDAGLVNVRLNQELFPPGPEHDVYNIMTFTVGPEMTPLHAAAKVNRPLMIDLLVNSGASVDIRGGYDDGTPLHQAAWNDCVAAAESLLNHGASINARSGRIHDNSPAGWAIVAGAAEVFELLIDHGADRLDWFLQDAKAALAGEFRMVRNAPQENHQRIMAKLI